MTTFKVVAIEFKENKYKSGEQEVNRNLSCGFENNKRLSDRIWCRDCYDQMGRRERDHEECRSPHILRGKERGGSQMKPGNFFKRFRKKPRLFRHGDLLIRKVTSIPKTAHTHLYKCYRRG